MSSLVVTTVIKDANGKFHESANSFDSKECGLLATLAGDAGWNERQRKMEETPRQKAEQARPDDDDVNRRD